jgi:hypothetical protein
MRFCKGLLVGIVVVGLAGCTVSTNTTAAPSNPPNPLPADAMTTARTAAAQFDSLYFASRFAASWALLAPDAQRQIPETVWVRVHDGCSSATSATSGVTRTIKSVTVFGNAAIVTESVLTLPSTRHTLEYVLNYADSRWSYSPGDLSIYHRRSIAADIAAAKAAGLCVSWKVF